MSEPRNFLVSFIVTEDHLDRLIGTLENAASACETFAEEASSNDLPDAADGWERDAKNIDILLGAIKGAKEEA